MKTTVKISDSEWEVMNLAWRTSLVSASDVVDKLAEKKGWQPRTTRTLLARLVSKGALKARRDGKRYLYEPRVTMEACVHEESRSFIDRVFGGAPASMLINLAKQTEFTPEEIRQLKKLLSDKER